MNLLDNKLYFDDILKTSLLNLNWERLKNKSILISGASGLIGSFLVDAIMYKNNNENLSCKIYACGRNSDKMKERFSSYCENPLLVLVYHDINDVLVMNDVDKIDFVLHLASNTHPVLYATEPINTITTNIIGTKNMLDFSVSKHAERFLFASSNEVYGENRGDVEKFKEEYCGYINCNTLRAGYPESKRCGEALCQAYNKQEGLDVVIARLTRSYGPTMLQNDSKAISQFIKKAIEGEDIVLKSEGNQYYSFTYVSDAVSGLLKVLLEGKCGEAYNIADNASDITLRDLAELIASNCNRKVVFELPDETEKAGFSKATKARLDSTKINNLGWKAQYSIGEGISRTIQILRDIQR